MIGSVQGLGRPGRAVVSIRSATFGDEPAVEPVAPVQPLSSVRLDRRSDFVAHLIATRDALAQTRERRRASMSEALKAYRETAGLDDAVMTAFEEVV